MGRRGMQVVLAVFLVLSLAKTAAAAEEAGSVRVTLNMTEGELVLYRVGSEMEEGYLLEKSYGGGFIKGEDALSPALAQWLAETVDDQGTYRLLDADGTAVFSHLTEGLYLLTQPEAQPGYYPIQPFLIAMPYSGQWHLEAAPKCQQLAESLPPTGQGPAPFLGLLGMALSGAGLVFCTVWKKKRK